MIVDIMRHLDKIYNFINMLNHKNFDKFLLLTDNIIEFNQELLSNNNNNNNNQENKQENNGLIIYNRINSRKLYTLIESININNIIDINNEYNNILRKYHNEIENDTICIQKLKISLNSEMDQHPITKVLFYDKSDKNKYFKVNQPQDINSLVNGKFYEYIIKVYKK